MHQPQTAEEAQADVAAMQQNHLTPTTLRRLNRGATWGSTLSLADLHLAESIGMEPVTVVSTESVQQSATDTQNRVLIDSHNNASDLVNAYYDARNVGLARMRGQALHVGAHAIIDLQHSFERHNRTAVEFRAVGTAVRFRDIPPQQDVIVSPMSGEAFFKLLRIGWLPVDLALGFHWHSMVVGQQTRTMERGWSNQEISTTTERFSSTAKTR